MRHMALYALFLANFVAGKSAPLDMFALTHTSHFRAFRTVLTTIHSVHRTDVWPTLHGAVKHNWVVQMQMQMRKCLWDFATSYDCQDGDLARVDLDDGHDPGQIVRDQQDHRNSL